MNELRAVTQSGWERVRVFKKSKLSQDIGIIQGNKSCNSTEGAEGNTK